MEKHRVLAENAALIAKWMQERGGVLVWGSVHLADPGRTWTTPAHNEDGSDVARPHWSATSAPVRTIMDWDEIEVHVPREVKRFHVGIRLGDQGMSYKVTDGGTRRIRAAVAKAGEDAWYEFDYETQEAVIFIPDKVIPLREYAPVAA